MGKYIQQVKVYDENGKELFLVENYNGAIALSIIDKTLTIRQSFREKIDKPTFVALDEMNYVDEYKDLDIKGYIASREIYVNYPEEDIEEFMNKFLTSKIKIIVAMINNDVNIRNKTRGYEIGSLLLITGHDTYSLREKLNFISDFLIARGVAFDFKRTENKIYIRNNEKEIDNG